MIKQINPQVNLNFNGPNFKGVYSNTATYYTGDSVSYLGSSYVALNQTTGNLPVVETYWQLLSGGGVSGNGIPTGGVSGDALVKNSSSDFDAGWQSLSTKLDVTTFNEKRKYLSVGVFDSTTPTFTDNGNSTCNVGSCTFIMYASADFSGDLEKYTVPAATNLGPFDSSGKYICVDYNSGSPIYTVKTSSQVNGSNIVPIFKCWWDGTYLHSLDSDSQALGLSNKISTMISSTMPYNRAGQTGLALGEAATRLITVTGAYVFAGTNPISVASYNSSTDLLTFAYYNGSAWVLNRATTQYDNSQYNPAGGLTSLSGNRFTVNWVYRSIGDVKECFYVLGDSQYNSLADAQLSKKRSDVPSFISQHCMLVGRIIVQQAASTASAIESSFDTAFQSSSVGAHNDLSGLQGGTTSQYYHQTAVQNASVDSVGNLVVPKTSGIGIKVDTATPTFGWKDLIGPIFVRTTGGNPPNWAVYRTNIYQYQFAVNNECWNEFHIPHDYLPGSDLYIHVHWSHTSATVTSGSVTFTFDITYAKGHNQAAFPATKTTTVTQTASTTQYQHMIAETVMTTSGGSASLTDSSIIEVDGLILVRTSLSGNTINGTPTPFVHYVDIHYQSTQMSTKNKAPNFYA